MSGNTNTDILIAGAVAAFTVDLLVYPLDTLKTRLQSPDYARRYTNVATGSANRALFRGLYQGVGSVIIATLPSSGAFFTTYEGAKSVYTQYNSTLGVGRDGKGGSGGLLPLAAIHSLASATAELVSCAILTPAEVIKQNAQMVPTASHHSPAHATMQVLARFRHNPLALWRGYTALAGRNLPFTALQFPIFERLKEVVKKYRDDMGTRSHTVLETGVITAVSAGSAGSLAAVVTTPVDVIKTRIMLAAAGDAAASAERSGTVTRGKPEGLVDALGNTVKAGAQNAKGLAREVARGSQRRKSSWAIGKEIVAESGFKGLWRGGALRGVRTMLGSGLYLGVYESGRIYLAGRRGVTLSEQDIL